MDSRREDRNKKIMLAVTAVLAVILVFMVFRVCSVLDSMDAARSANRDSGSYAYYDGGRPQYYIDGEWYTQKADVETVLLIGKDKYEADIPESESYRNKQQADALFLLAIDRTENKYRVLQINRDTMASIRALGLKSVPYDVFDAQLALSHTYGTGGTDSCENVVYSVSDFLYGLRIDHYVSFTMDAVPIINDAVGGVTLTILDDMTPVDASMVQGTEMTLMGEQALRYIRARGGLAVSTNVERMKRQRQYVTALIEKGAEEAAKDSSLFADVINDISQYIVSDCASNKLVNIANDLVGKKFVDVSTPEGRTNLGEKYIEFYVDEDSLRNLLLDIFYDKVPGTVTSSAADSATAEET